MSNYPIPEFSAWSKRDPSKLKDYRTCERKYFFRHLLGWAGTAPNNDLIFGQATHAGKEHLWKIGYNDEAIKESFQKFINLYRPEFGEDTDELFEGKTPDGYLNAMIEYCQKYHDDFERYEVLYTEIAGTVPVDEKRVLYFRMDSVLEEKSSGKKISMDLKTTKTPTFSGKNALVWVNDFTLAIQSGCYTHCLYCMYPREEVKGMIFDGFGVGKNKSGYNCNFLRAPVYLTPRQMQVWLWNVLDILDQLDHDMERLSESKDSDEVLQCFPMRTENCTKYFRMCPYHDFCCTWSNPLQHGHEVPLGFKQEFWDPEVDESEVSKKVELEY